MKKVVASLLISIPVFCLGQTNVHDENFSNWTVGSFTGTNVGSVTGVRVANQGVTGDAYQLTATRQAGSSSFTWDAEIYKTDYAYNPATQGAILSIGWSAWERVTSFQNLGDMKILAKQGDSYYVAGTAQEVPLFQTAPQFFGGNSVSGDGFGKIKGTRGASLDYSASAPVINFGFYVFNPSFSTGPAQPQISFVDFNIQSVPEPPVVLIVTGLALVSRRNRRKVQL